MKTIALICSLLLLFALFGMAYALDLQDYAVPQQKEIPEDAYCIWQIPELDISVPVYTHGEQETIDADDSALLTPYGRAYRIGDHRGSGGKWYIEKIPLNTLAFMVKRDEIIRYRCFAVMRVDVLGSVFGINGRIVTEYSSTDIICSCCAENENERYLAFFRKVS